jgi:hypothetical protein
MDPIVRAMARAGSSTTHAVSVAATAALMAGASLAIWFPGEAGPDSQSQYAQAVAGHLDDWHPPIMAWLWSIFRLVADGDGPMFCFQVAGYWLGFGLIAIALARAGRPFAAWTMLGVALFPSFFTLHFVLLKDVGMAVTFLTAFAALFLYRSRDREIPPPVAAIAFVLLLYGALVRANAVFAVVPLFVYLIRPQWLGRPWRLLAVSLPVALALVPAADLFNQRILRAEPLGPIRSLQVFDMAGISFYSADLTVFGPGRSFTREEVTRCYSPEFWDHLAPWGECRFFWNRLAVSPDLQGVAGELDARGVMGAEPNPDLRNLWIAAIVHHPLAYARHRLAHFFGSEIWRGASMKDLDVPPPLSLVLYDCMTASAIWLAIGVGLLVQLVRVRGRQRTASIDAALALVLSGLPYAGAYLVIGVSTELRYLYWSLMAIFVAVVIALPELRAPSARRQSGALYAPHHNAGTSNE